MSDINQPSLPTPFIYLFISLSFSLSLSLSLSLSVFLSVSLVLMSVSAFIALSTVFHSIHSPDNSPFSDSVRPVLSLPYFASGFNCISLYESLLQP